MRLRALSIMVAMIAFSGAVLADDDTFTQIGKWSCSYPNYDRTGPFICPPANFPQPFGGIPQVSFTNSYAPCGGITCVTVKDFQNITANGFTPTLYLGGGRAGHQGGVAYGDWIAVGPRPPVQGVVSPKYMVLVIIYAPPGTNGGKSTSSVEYGAGSTAGNTTSISHSFKSNVAVSLEGSGGFLGKGIGAGLSFAYTRGIKDTQSVDIKRGDAVTLSVSGPSKDGIDHDHDMIYLWLNPSLNVTLSSSSASWIFSGSETADIQYVYTGWLKDPQKMSKEAPGVFAKLQQYGFTTDDLATILQRDPLVGTTQVFDQQRFRPLNFTFPYEPPFSASDPVPVTTYSLSNSSISTSGTEASDEYKVGVKLSADSDGFLDMAKSKLQASASWDWTNVSSASNSSGRSEIATVKIGGPAFGYTGPTDMRGFFDTVYRTFVFAPVSEPLVVKGRIVDATGNPIAGTEVTAIMNGGKHITVTNRKGEYKFFGNMPGEITIQAGGTTKTYPQAQSVRELDAITQ